jgi:peptidoglycan/LPS O-acetylase OafA/YrhL
MTGASPAPVQPRGRGLHEESANLDLLRSVAVLLVLVSHIPVALGHADGRWGVVTLAGRYGVLMFFIHTSLVLMMSLERSERQGPALIRRFYIRRAFRI